MNLLADESIDKPIVDRLRRHGYDVVYVAERSPSISDSEVLREANDQEALLLTAGKDFGELVFRQRRLHGGVVFIRLQGISAEHKAAIVAEAVRSRGTEMAGAFTVISPGIIRIRRTP